MALFSEKDLAAAFKFKQSLVKTWLKDNTFGEGS